jgi:hypothetical protein
MHAAILTSSAATAASAIAFSLGFRPTYKSSVTMIIPKWAGASSRAAIRCLETSCLRKNSPRDEPTRRTSHCKPVSRDCSGSKASSAADLLIWPGAGRAHVRRPTLAAERGRGLLSDRGSDCMYARCARGSRRQDSSRTRKSGSTSLTREGF